MLTPEQFHQRFAAVGEGAFHCQVDEQRLYFIGSKFAYRLPGQKSMKRAEQG